MQPTTFSELFDASYVITKAYARFDLGSIKELEALPAVHAREVLTSWAFSTLSYANQPQISEVDVCAKAPEESEYALSLDISDLARKWQNEPCYGVVMDVREDNKQIDIKGKFHIAVIMSARQVWKITLRRNRILWGVPVLRMSICSTAICC